jgi:hypothetical protein
MGVNTEMFAKGLNRISRALAQIQIADVQRGPL